MLLTARIDSTPVKYVMRKMFNRASSVIARAGTWNRLSTPSSRIVIPSLEMP